MHLLIRLSLLGLQTAWALNGAVETRSDSATEPLPDGKSLPTMEAAPVRRPESSSQGLSEQQQQQQQQRRRKQSGTNTVVAAEDDGLVGSDWGRGKEEEEEREEGEEAEAWGQGQEEKGEEEPRRVPLESRQQLSGRTKEPEPEPGSEKRPDTPMVSRLKSGAFGTNSTSDYASEWKGAGGLFGLSADWREAIQRPDQGARDGVSGRHMSLRGEACMAEEKRAEVQAILDKRRRTAPSKQNVAICVRTKDYGRFLPEWIAFHYAAGVDQITVYDDDSVDNTKEILQPFVKAGIVRYILESIENQDGQMRPLNRCLDYYLQQRKKKGDGSSNSPRWVLFHDTDEYLYPVDTDMTILQALERHEDACCLVVERVQYGSGGHDEMPRGLMLEDFLMHNYRGGKYGNGNPKVMVNLDPTQPELGTIKVPLKSMHNGQGCTCHGIGTNGAPELLINHYLGSIGDYMDRTKRYWALEKRRGEMTSEKTVLNRDKNDLRSDEILHWACATREILHRVVEGLDLDDEGLDLDDD